MARLPLQRRHVVRVFGHNAVVILHRELMLALRLPHEALEPLHAQRFGEAFGQRVAVLLCELERRVSDRLGVLAVLEQGHVHLLVCRPHLLPQPRAVAVQKVRAQLRDELCVVDPGLAPHVRDGPASRVEADGRGNRCVEVHTREPGLGGVGRDDRSGGHHDARIRTATGLGVHNFDLVVVIRDDFPNGLLPRSVASAAPNARASPDSWPRQKRPPPRRLTRARRPTRTASRPSAPA